MITVEMIIAKFDLIKEDSSYSIDTEENEIRLIIEDFVGFDEDWSEIFRKYDIKAVKSVLSWLKENADFIGDEYYTDYHFGEITVSVGYSSYDI